MTYPKIAWMLEAVVPSNEYMTPEWLGVSADNKLIHETDSLGAMHFDTEGDAQGFMDRIGLVSSEWIPTEHEWL